MPVKRSARPSRRWLARLAFALLALLILAAISHPIWLAAIGGFLVKADPPERADLVIVLAGDWSGNRILKAGELVKQGLAPVALIDGPRHHFGLREYELAIPFAVRNGYPERYFEGFPVDANSTREEAALLNTELRRRGVKKVLVVTSNYHTRRSGILFREIIRGCEFRIVAAPDKHFRPGDWWLRREAQKTVFHEWVKLLTTPFGL
ncbi:MAG: YdcF family protein [Acidimicrobiia bacterium]|nr:YdcF family protein [Acidimicrobiia bacterium]